MYEDPTRHTERLRPILVAIRRNPPATVLELRDERVVVDAHLLRKLPLRQTALLTQIAQPFAATLAGFLDLLLGGPLIIDIHGLTRKLPCYVPQRRRVGFFVVFNLLYHRGGILYIDVK